MTTFMAFYGVEMHCRKTITGIKRATIRRRDDKELSHRITRCCWFMAPHFGLIPVVVPAAVFPMRLMTLATLVSRFFCNVATDLYTAAPIQRTHFCIFLMQLSVCSIGSRTGKVAYYWPGTRHALSHCPAEIAGPQITALSLAALIAALQSSKTAPQPNQVRVCSRLSRLFCSRVSGRFFLDIPLPPWWDTPGHKIRNFSSISLCFLVTSSPQFRPF